MRVERLADLPHGTQPAVSGPFRGLVRPSRGAQDAPPPWAACSGLFAMTRLARPNSARSCPWFLACPGSGPCGGGTGSFPYHMGRVLDLGPHTGLQPLGLLQQLLPGAGLVRGFALARLHGHVPGRPLGLLAFVYAAVARITEGRRFLPVQQRAARAAASRPG